MVEIRLMTINDWKGVEQVWKDHEGTNPVDDCEEGFTRYLKRNPTTSFVAMDGDKMIGTILAGHDGRRGFFHHVVFEHNDLGNGFWEHIGFTTRPDLVYRNKYVK